MATGESAERVQIDKEVVKVALREILEEIPSFRSMSRRNRDDVTPGDDRGDSNSRHTTQNGQSDTNTSQEQGGNLNDIPDPRSGLAGLQTNGQQHKEDQEQQFNLL